MSKLTHSGVEKCIYKIKSITYDEILLRISKKDDRDKIKKWIHFKINSFLHSTNMHDEEEFQLTLMWFYVQLKSEWSLLNTHNQYKQMRGYDPPLSYHYRLSVLSITIKEIENFINLFHVDGVASFLSLPMSEFERNL